VTAKGVWWMKFAAWFAIIVGLLMIGQWLTFLARGQVPELYSEPVRLSFHLFAELATAIALLMSGVALLRHLVWGSTLYLLAAGMLIYTVMVSPGYFAQQGEWGMVAMFGLLLVLAIANVINLMRAKAL
jgi:hypothetical protein